MNDNIIKASKEFLRIVVLSMIPIIIMGLESGNLNPKLIIMGGVIAGLKFIDKLLHEIGKEDNNELLVTGLTRF